MWFRRRKTNALINAEQALESAQKSLAKIQRRDPAVKRVSESLRTINTRNHFGEQLEEIIMRRGQTR